MKFLRFIFIILPVCLLFFTLQSCNTEPVERLAIVDTDGDGIVDSLDNCVSIANPNQEDDDNDGIGNLCDNDFADPNAPLAQCIDGFADVYPCNDYDLMGYVSIDDLGGAGSSGNDCWGWVDPTTQKEYVIYCANNGVAFVDISTPNNPIVVGKLLTATINSAWRDAKIYNNYAFIVADRAGNHGMQVFDLTRLRNVSNPPETFASDARFTEFGSAHNIVINESSPYAYIVGTGKGSSYLGATIMVDIQNPLNSVNLGTINGYSHDALVVTYNGPDTEHNGKEIYIGSNENIITIVDITDKSNPLTLSTVNYSNVGYTHQGWLSEDMSYFILGDELDELNNGNNTKTIVFDFTDLDNPTFAFNYFGPTEAIDHNGYVVGNTFYLANYRAGVRMIDISNIQNNSFQEIGFFDTYPENDIADFDGAWSVYPYFPSENIAISDINRGLFIVRKSDL
ncbi:choice-of-anchor B family protein [Sabulilitoribacter multivorans]|uniref:Choice-of-anchor B family protein n=1 Tax=Flaviramulus multivorans TaxID=1304750 RepID=A0ABS9IGE2_9FLAO|nr:choice-of-anchor B family protein [Flaviramulus multivorans]MCF7559799.1 choice-of-anchor B family protein [Flaviramulus multivorans]